MKLSNLIKALDDMESFTLLYAVVLLIVFVFAVAFYVFGPLAILVVPIVATIRVLYAASTGK